MTYMLDEAIKRTRTLSDAEQDAIAALIFAELEEERLWDEAFDRSPETLSQFAREALDEHRSGKTLPLDPDRM